MVETTRLRAGSAESTNSFGGKPQKPDLVTSCFFSAAPCNLSWVIAPKKSIYYSDAWLRSCSTVADIREARTIWQSALCSYKHVSVLCLEMFCCLLEIQKIDSWRKKLFTNIKKLSYRKKTTSVRSDGFWRLSSPSSPELLPDQWPPSSRHRARKWERDL